MQGCVGPGSCYFSLNLKVQQHVCWWCWSAWRRPDSVRYCVLSAGTFQTALLRVMSTRWRLKLACSCVHNTKCIVGHSKITVFCNVTPDNLIVTDVSEVRAVPIFTVALWLARCNQFIYSRVFVLAWFLQRIKLRSSVVSLTYKAQWSLYVPHSGHYMYHEFNFQQFSALPTQCIYVFCMDLRTNSDYFPIQH
jgi:hypothetical protein